jgi:hypothetical protein
MSRTGAVRELIDVETINLSSQGRLATLFRFEESSSIRRTASREVYTRAELNRTGGGGGIGGVRGEFDNGAGLVSLKETGRTSRSWIRATGEEIEEKVIELWVSKQLALPLHVAGV